MIQFSLSLLGPFHPVIDGQPVEGFRSDKVRALLAYLAVEAGRPHRREALAALFWPDWPDADALRNLRKSLHRLRHPLDQRAPGLSDRLLAVTRQTIQLHAGALSLDVALFRDLLARVEAHPHRHLHLCHACLARLVQAAELYAGDLLTGLSVDDAPAFEEWLVVAQQQLHTQALTALHRLAGAYLQRGEYALAHRYAARQLAIEPWHEKAHRQSMRALALDERRTEALAQYELCRRILREELDTEPESKTTALYRQIVEGDAPLEEPGTTVAKLHHLPAQFTPFVGRQAELARIVDCLLDPDCRLLSLVGPGGIGKTRLAVEAVQQAAVIHGSFDDGIFFVPLAAVRAPELLPPALASNLGLTLQPHATARAQVLDRLQGRNLLLVLDNLEHLLDGQDVHDLLLAILGRAPAIKILVTSRHPLDLQAEWLMRVEGLSYPDHDYRPPPTAGACDECPYSAVQLFLQAAARARVGFSPAREQCTTAIQICRLLHGMPLAIEIAATWMRSHDIETIHAQVERSLDFLATPLRDVPPRHRSVRAVFDHSWELLTTDEQSVLARASVFCGGFDAEAATTLLAAADAATDQDTQMQSTVAATLSSLVAKSLLRRTDDGRYTMHELLHQFASEKLAAHPAPGLGRRHSHYYSRLVARQAAALYGRQPKQARLNIHRDLDNIRAAWQWAVLHDSLAYIAHSVDGLARYYVLGGSSQEAETLLATAVEHLAGRHGIACDREPDRTPVLSRLFSHQATFLAGQARNDRALATAAAAVDLAHKSQDAEALALARGVLGWVLQVLGQYDEALAVLEQAHAYYQAHGNRPQAALMLVRIGTVEWRRGNYRRTLAAYEQALALEKRAGHQVGISRAIGGLGLVYIELGEYDLALASLQQALEADRALGNQHGIARNLGNMGTVYERQGNLERALACYHESAELDRASGQKGLMAMWLANIGGVFLKRGDPQQALAYFDQAIPILRDVGDRFNLAEALLGKAQALHEQNGLADTHPNAARACADEGLRLAVDTGHQACIMRGQALQTRLAAATGD